jgi:glucokinase
MNPVTSNKLPHPKSEHPMDLFLGIEIGGTKLVVALGDEHGNIRERRKLTVDRFAGAPGIRAQLEEVLPELIGQRRILAAGVGFGGPVDWGTGKIWQSHQIAGWSDFNLSDWLRKLVGVPVAVDNDANVAALAEARHGAGVGHDPVFYVTLGSGVGGGLVLDGESYHGATPGEAEIGHVRLDRRGTTLESRCSGWAVDARIRRLNRKHPKDLMARMAGGTADGGEAQHLAAAISKGNSAAKAILEATAEDLAFGLSHVVHLFHPQLIVLGGGLSGVGEPLRLAVQQALPRFIMDVFKPGPRIALAALGEDAVPVGALELAMARASQVNSNNEQ